MSNLSSKEIFKIFETTEKLAEALQNGMRPYKLLNQAYDLARYDRDSANDKNLKTSLINFKIVADKINFSDLTLDDKVTTARIIDEVKAEAHPDIMHSCQKLIESYESYIEISKNFLYSELYEKLHFFLRLDDKTMAEEFLIKFSSDPPLLPSNLLMIIKDKLALNNLISFLVKTDQVKNSKDIALDFIALLNIDEIKSLKKSLQFDAMNFTTKNGRNILYSTIKYGTLENLTILLKNLKDTKIDINGVDSENLMALDFALKYGTPEKVQILLDHPRSNLKNIKYSYYISLKKLHILLEHSKLSLDTSETILKDYVSKFRISSAWSSYSDINIGKIKSKSGKTLLHYALNDNNEELVKLLLQDPSVNVNSKDCYGYTPLHYAIHTISGSVLKILLKHPKIDVNSQNNDNYGILHRAIIWQSTILSTLLQYPKCDINLSVTLSTGILNTPLELTAKYRTIYNIIILLKNSKISITKNLYGLSTDNRTTITGYLDSLSEEANLKLWINIIKEYDKYAHLHHSPFFKDALSKWEPRVKLYNSKEAEILSDRDMSFTPGPTPLKKAFSASATL